MTATVTQTVTPQTVTMTRRQHRMLVLGTVIMTLGWLATAGSAVLAIRANDELAQLMRDWAGLAQRNEKLAYEFNDLADKNFKTASACLDELDRLTRGPKGQGL